MTSSAAVLVCALVSWGAIIAWMFALHLKITRLEKRR